MKRRDPLLDPLPKWKQHQARLVAWWRRSKDRRRTAYANMRKAGRKGLTLAISLAGATLVSYGIWAIFPPAGLITAGLLLWAIQWNYGDERGEG